MPGVDFGLQLIALAQQGGVARRHCRDQRCETVPEPARLNAAARYGLAIDEIVQGFIDFKSAYGNRRSHCTSPTTHE